MVNEIIKTILFFFTRNFYKHKKHKKHKKTHINKQKQKKTSKKKSLVCLFTSDALHIKTSKKKVACLTFRTFYDLSESRLFDVTYFLCL